MKHSGRGGTAPRTGRARLCLAGRKALSLLRLQAGRLLLIAVLMQLILGLTQLPLIGLLIILSVPGLSAGLLEAFHVAAQAGGRSFEHCSSRWLPAPTTAACWPWVRWCSRSACVSMSLLLSGSEELMDPALLERIEQGDLDAMASLNQESLARMALAFLLGVSVSGTTQLLRHSA